MLSPKELKKLAAACRDAGIKHYKADGIEFTLTDEMPVKHVKKLASNPVEAPEPVETDSLSEEDILFWSSGSEELGN